MEVIQLGLDGGPRARYDRLHEACPDAFVQQSTAWAEVIAPLGPDEPLFLLLSDAGEDLAGLPLYLFRGRRGPILTSVPQPGPLGGVFTAPGLDPARRRLAYRLLLDRARDLACRLGCLTLTVLTNPFDDDRPLYDACLGPALVLENYTQYVPLDRPARRAGSQKNNLVRAEKFGFSVAPATTAADLRAWYALHERRQADVGGRPLDFRLFDNILRVLAPRDRTLLLLARDGDRLAAGTVYVWHRRVWDVFAISMDADYAAHAPNALLADRSMQLARRRGAAVYNWQSSPGRQSGVYAHKRMWGSVEAPYAFVTALLSGERLDGVTPGELADDYAGHYVVPFPAVAEGLQPRRYHKA